ncbi:hypothetical protein QFC21_004929 [Naganishia friedmannii]|uniref:Uncharacterized protein n=1 Tax=Naganishia friedmannii TaxID=89922 RepID=A0ACC2VE97_9TREE|nr:hypothetical protein QFC21_004929 [Naganishia friedmannii]
MSFSDQYLPDGSSNTLDATLGVGLLLTPPLSPTKVQKVLPAQDDDHLLQNLLAIIQSYWQPEAPGTSRTPFGTANNAARVEAEGPEGDAEGEIDPACFEPFPDYLGDDEPEAEPLVTVTAGAVIPSSSAPAIQPEEQMPLVPQESVTSYVAKVAVQTRKKTTKPRKPFCGNHMKKKDQDVAVLECEKCQQTKVVNTIIQEERRKFEAIKTEAARQAGLLNTDPREKSLTCVERTTARNEAVQELLLKLVEFKDDTLEDIGKSVSPDHLEKLKKELLRREARGQFPYGPI